MDSLFLNHYDHLGALDLQTVDNGMIAAGYAYNNLETPQVSKPYLLKLNNDLQIEWEVLAGTKDWGEAWASVVTSEGEYAVTGSEVIVHEDDSYTTYGFLSKIEMNGTESSGIKNSHGPKEFVLKQNYPNPFNPSCNIEYELSTSGHVELSVFNLKGEKVVALVNENQQAGSYKIHFDGSHLSNGTYICQLKHHNQIQTQKLVLLK